MASEAPSAEASSPSSHGPVVSRRVRIAVYAFLSVFFVCGIFEIQVWPLPGWRLFSEPRTDESLMYRPVAVTRVGPPQVLTDGSAPTFRNFFFVADHFRTMSPQAQRATCETWLASLRHVIPTVVSLRVYRVVQELVPRSRGRPALPPTATLAFSCSGQADFLAKSSLVMLSPPQSSERPASRAA